MKICLIPHPRAKRNFHFPDIVFSGFARAPPPGTMLGETSGRCQGMREKKKAPQLNTHTNPTLFWGRGSGIQQKTIHCKRKFLFARGCPILESLEHTQRKKKHKTN